MNTFRTYTYTVKFYGKDKEQADVNWERSMLYIDIEDYRNVTDEQVGLRKSVVNYDIFGAGWICEETEEIWTFGDMSKEKMLKLEQEYYKLSDNF